jgi:hypothetical protein
VSRRAHVMVGGVWPPVMGVSSRKISELDRNMSELMNFDGGGFYNPTGPIVVGGKGMQLGPSCTMKSARTLKGYGANDPRIELRDQWPLFSAPRTRVTTVSWSEGNAAEYVPVPANGRGSLVPPFGRVLSVMVDDHRLHQGGTLTKATFSFRYTGTKPTSTGSEQVRIIRRAAGNDGPDVTGYMHTNGSSLGITYSGSSATRDAVIASDIDEVYSGGNVINLAYVPNQNNVIDKSLYLYEFRISSDLAFEAIGLRLEWSVADLRFP